MVKGDQVGKLPFAGLAPSPTKELGVIRQADWVVRGYQVGRQMVGAIR